MQLNLIVGGLHWNPQFLDQIPQYLHALCRTVTYLPQEKANLLSSSFNSKPKDRILNLLLQDLDRSGGVNPNGLFPLVLIMIVDNSAPRLAAVFRILIR